MKYIFIRDDDVFSFKEESFYWFWDLATRLQLPVMYAVIPAKLDVETVKVLSKYREDYPNMIDIAQHGYTHQNHNPNIYPKYEFGPARSKGQQKQDILSGIRLMDKFFGSSLPKIFVPPFDGYDIVTLKYIEEFGFDVFSADDTSFGIKYRFLNLPYLFAINDYAQDGMPIPISFEEMLKRYFVFFNAPYKLIGILVHHSAYGLVSSRNALSLFMKFLRREERKEHIRIILPSTLLKYRY